METRPHQSDREILMEIAQNQDKLAILVDRYRNPMYNFVFRFVGDQETAEDIVQETFLRCLKHSAKCPPIEYVRTWLYTIAGNLAKSELRRRKRWRWVSIGPSDEETQETSYEPVDKEQLPDERTDSWNARAAVIEAIGQLPEEFRQAVLLRDINGLSYQEIATATQCPVGTVKSRVNRGRLRLQQQLRGLAGELVDTLAPANALGA